MFLKFYNKVNKISVIFIAKCQDNWEVKVKKWGIA